MRKWLLIAGITGIVAVAVPVVREMSADATSSVAYTTVRVPVGATLTINGQRTEQMTGVRQFVTPPLPHGGTFSYEFIATFTWNGTLTSKKQLVRIRAGESLDIDMMAAPDFAAPAPVVVPPEVPVWLKEEPKRPEPKKPVAQPKVEPPKFELPSIPPYPEPPAKTRRMPPPDPLFAES